MWNPVFDGQPVLNVGALAAHPSNSDIVYVGTGEANGAGYSYDGDGVYRTLASSVTDAGVPPAGAAFWYLVRAKNVCGTGTYGSASGGSPRLGTACP
jgi:hypothetical protein